VSRPMPRPPAELQPTRYSVTAIETLYRDPYRIYADRILGLNELPDLVADPTFADRGSLLHGIVEDFSRLHPLSFPPDAGSQLVLIGRRRFEAFAGSPEVAAFWWPRFLLAAAEFERWELRRRPDLARVVVEQTTALDLMLADGTPVRLSGKADRVELDRDGRFGIIDFKTGTVPKNKVVDAGFAPQLTLQAELAARAGFAPDLAPAPVSEVLYVKLSHRADDWGAKPLAFKEAPLADVAALHMDRLLVHLARLRSGEEAFLPRRALHLDGHASAYDHLARVKEWSAAGGGGDEAGPA